MEFRHRRNMTTIEKDDSFDKNPLDDFDNSRII
jgi:hypothetical protein